MTASPNNRRRFAATPSHVADHRQRQDALLADLRTREDALITKYNSAKAEVSMAEESRDADLVKLKEQGRSIRETAAAKIAAARKEMVQAVKELKKDHTAEEAAPLLDVAVEQFNKLLYSNGPRREASQADNAEPRPDAETPPPSAATEPQPPSASNDELFSAQIALAVLDDHAGALEAPPGLAARPSSTRTGIAQAAERC